MLDNKSEKYIRERHVEGGSAIEPSKGVFDRDINLDELVEQSLTVEPTGPNREGFFERVVDAGAVIGRSSEVTGSRVTSKYILVQDRFGGIRSMYPLPPN